MLPVALMKLSPRYRCGGGVRRVYGAAVSDEVAPVGASVLSEVDDILPEALTVQGETAHGRWG